MSRTQGEPGTRLLKLPAREGLGRWGQNRTQTLRLLLTARDTHYEEERCPGRTDAAVWWLRSCCKEAVPGAFVC